MERSLDSGFSVPPEPWRLRGDVRINQRPVSGGNLAWSNVQVGISTLNATVTAGVTTSFAVTTCPALPVGGVSVIAQNNFTRPGAFFLDQALGIVTTCVGTTLTLTAPALVSSGAGANLEFLQWRQAAHTANDTAGTSWPIATVTDIADLVICNANTVGFGVVDNGVSVGTGGYGAAVSATGSTVRPVFCDGTSWTYH
jgi:hypothetical protein